MLFSFYYRHMLGLQILRVAPRGAYNMHGSLLPKYRGRAPVNWAVLQGETETGATLHVMVEKPDAGPIVDQEAVPILPDDTALDVFHKVTVAAELALNRCLPALLTGKTRFRSQDLSRGSYFGRRTATDGAIDWGAGVQSIHNLVRAVAPPYPGAFSEAAGLRLRVLRTLPSSRFRSASPVLRWKDNEVWALCPDGALRLLEFQLGESIARAEAFFERFGDAAVDLAAQPVSAAGQTA
jgi:methionyl-tRNA formyltransferase